MRTLALLWLVLGAACQQPLTSPSAATPQAPKPGAATATTPSSEWTAGQRACVEAYLETHALDGFGSPRGTMYPGGTPLFDEATGQRLSREEYLVRRHPEVLRGCPR